MFERLKAMVGGDSSSRDPRDDFWYGPIGGASSAGVSVSAATAMTISAFYSGVKLIAETAGQLPLQVFERKANGDKAQAASHPIYDLLHDQPNDEHTAIEFREMLTAWAVMRGTGMAEILPGRRGAVDQLIPLHPDYLRPVKVMDASGRSRWQVEVREPSAPVRRLLRDEVFILRGLATDKECPLLGVDPITIQKNTLGAAIAANDYSSRFFANDARPSGVIKHPTYFKDDASRNNWKAAFQRAFGGANRHKLLLLEWGMEYQQVSITPEQAQFLETRKLQAEDVARILRVQPHKIGLMDHATFGNIEHQALEFVQDTMMPWLIRWEQAIKRDLIQRPVFFAEHNVAGLLRGDMKSMAEAFAIARNWGWINVNEIRRFLNMNSIGEEGEVYLQPLNMTEAGQPGEPSQQQRVPGSPRRPQDGDTAAGPPLIISPGLNGSRTNGEAHG